MSARHFVLREWLAGLGVCAACCLFFALWMEDRSVKRATACKAKRRCNELVRDAWEQQPREAA